MDSLSRGSMRLPLPSAVWLALLVLAGSHATAHAGFANSYAAATDLREFVERREASPENGSFFYAYLARWECFDHGATERRPVRSAKQAKAIQQQVERCRNLPRGVTAGSAQRQDIKDGRLAGDKLFSAFNGADASWFRVNDQVGLLHALGFLSPGADPNMSWVVAQKLAGLGTARRILVNGERLSDAEGRSLYVSFLLAACDINVHCGSSHLWMRSWCAYNAECDDASIEAYWRRTETTRQDRMDWTAIARYRAMIVAAARATDWSSFSVVPER